MRENQALQAKIIERSRVCFSRPLILGTVCLALSGSAMAGDYSSADMPWAGPETPSVDLPRIDTIAAVLWQRFKVARQESMLIAQAVVGAANEYALSPALLLAVIATESGFDRQAVSVAGARGLMQILPTAHARMMAASKDPMEPVENVRLGSSILRGYLDAADGDLAVALRRYSGGGKGYAQRVTWHMREFSADLRSQAGISADWR
jgi:Transglycosylase SLT domain